LPYEIDIELRGNHVRVCATGERRTGDAAFEAGQAGRHIVEFCQKAEVNRAYAVKQFADEEEGLEWLLAQ